MVSTFVVVCCYFSALDVLRARSKLQGAYHPTLRDMARAALPQLALYLSSEAISWTVHVLVPAHRCPMPPLAPTLGRLARDVLGTLVVGDFLIYWEHRMVRGRGGGASRRGGTSRALADAHGAVAAAAHTFCAPQGEWAGAGGGRRRAHVVPVLDSL